MTMQGLIPVEREYIRQYKETFQSAPDLSRKLGIKYERATKLENLAIAELKEEYPEKELNELLERLEEPNHKAMQMLHQLKRCIYYQDKDSAINIINKLIIHTQNKDTMTNAEWNQLRDLLEQASGETLDNGELDVEITEQATSRKVVVAIPPKQG